MVEDPLLDVPMRITSTGILYVKGQFIEETRSYMPPIPSPSGSITYDDFDSYFVNIALNGLNSGSNEWDNKSPLAAYVASEGYAAIKAGDSLGEYTDGTVLTASNMIMGGFGWWSGSYAFNGYDNIWSVTYDTFEFYDADTFINGSGSYVENTTLRRWTGGWIGRRQIFGMVSHDDFELYSADSDLSGSGETPNVLWPWNGNWTSRNDITGSV
jgi:hypothetical protein